MKSKFRRIVSGFTAVTLFVTTIGGMVTLTSHDAHADVVVGSWNVQRLGHGQQKSYPSLAHVGRHMDLIAVQETMIQAGLDQMEAALEKLTGEPWSTMASHAIGSKSYKEMYAFLWRDSAVEYLDGAVVYLDRGDRFIREPYSARFTSRKDGSQFVLATVHILYGNGISDRTPEIRALADYWDWMGEVYGDTPRILVGDFNLAPDHPAWSPLMARARPLITKGASTLSSINGRYANLYDNIWVEKDSQLQIGQAGIIDFPKLIGWDHEKSRKHTSDHAPVFVALGDASLSSIVPLVHDSAVRNQQRLAHSHPARGQSPSLSTKLNNAGHVRGNRNSKIYHRPDCPSYNSVGERNRVEFASAAAAAAAGFRIAGNCP